MANEILGILRNDSNDGQTPLAVIHDEADGHTDVSMPGMVAIDATNKHKKLLVDDSGALVITNEGATTKYSNKAFVTVAASGTPELLIDIPLGAAGETLNLMEWHFAGMRDLELEFFYVDDVGVTDVETKIFQVNKESDIDASGSVKCLNLDTTGGTDLQGLRVKINQKQGTPIESFGYVCIEAE